MEFLYKTLYTIIYYYSCFEIWAQKTANQWSDNYVVKQINRFFQVDPEYQFLFVENGNQSVVYKNKNFEPNALQLSEPENYDFIIRNDLKKRNHKIIYDKVKDIKVDYEVSNVSFLSFLVHYKTTDIEIHLDTKTYTYMIVDNCIDKKFIYYLLKNMDICLESFEDFTYSLQILTSDVNFLHLTSNDKIIIKKNHIQLK